MRKKCLIADRHAELGETSEKCFCCGLIIGESYEVRLRKKVDAVPRETKQKFLDAMWAGKTIGEASEIAGFETTELACGVLNENIAEHKYLRTTAV